VAFLAKKSSIFLSSEAREGRDRRSLRAVSRGASSRARATSVRVFHSTKTSHYKLRRLIRRSAVDQDAAGAA